MRSLPPLSLVPFLALLAAVAPSCGLRDVRLEMPPVVRAGGSATLKCPYELESAPLYSVKWYRGTFEFYRVLPQEKISRTAFPYPGINVDLSQSNEHQVTLRRVPVGLSGTFSCEVSADSPSFSTTVVSGQLVVLDLNRRPLLTLSKEAYAPGDVLEANCTSEQEPADFPALAESPWAPRDPMRRPLLVEEPPLQPHQLTPAQRAHLQDISDTEAPTTVFAFYVNNMMAPSWQVRQTSRGAFLQRELSEHDFRPSFNAAAPSSEVRVKCVTSISGMYRAVSHVVTARRLAPDEPRLHTPSPSVDQHVEASVSASGGVVYGASGTLHPPALCLWWLIWVSALH